MSDEEQPNKKDPEAPKPTGLSAFWDELKRRKVMRVAIAYAVVGWLLIQVTATVFPQLGIPDWAAKLVTLMLLIGFPIAIILAWAFELTPEGIKTSKTAREAHPEAYKDESHAKKRNRLTILLAAGLPTAIFGALALFFFFSRSAPDSSDVASLEKSIAVLPLDNLSPDPDNAFFADGVQEDILTHLSKINELGVVISRSSTLKYRDPDRNLKQVGQELGVRYIVEGSVRRAANQVRVTVQLIDSQTDDHLWAENYDRSLDDIFTIQSEIAKTIADQLQAVISPQEIALIEIRPTENQEAYDYYVKARQLIEGGGTNGDEKIALLEKAVALDSNFAEAWASLVTEAIFWWDAHSNRNDPTLRKKAHHALREAERTGGGLPHIHLARHTIAFREDRDLEASINHLLAAIAIDPNFRLAHNRLGFRYIDLGRMAEAQHHLEISLRMDPFVPQTNAILHYPLTRRGMWDRAMELADKNIQYSQGFFWKYRRIFISYLRTGDRDTFAKNFEEIVKSSEGEYDDRDKIRYALLTRDYPRVLKILHDNDRYVINTSFSRVSAFGLMPRGVMKPLISFENGNAEESLKEARNAVEFLGTTVNSNPLAYPNYWSELAICYAILGNLEQMDGAMVKAREISSAVFYRYNHQVSVELHIAIAYLILGDEEKAIELLESALELESFTFLNRELDLWFMFDRLRGNPRFDALLK